MEEPHLAEWGLRKVLPASNSEQRSAFARRVIPVILELCRADMNEEEFEELMKRCETVLCAQGEPAPASEEPIPAFEEPPPAGEG